MSLETPAFRVVSRRFGDWLTVTPVIFLVAVLVVVAVGLLGLGIVEQLSQSEVSNRLVAEVNTSAQALKLWTEEQRRTTESWGGQPAISELCAALVRKQAAGKLDRDQLIGTSELSELRRQLGPICQIHGFAGFVVFDAERTQLAALQDEAVGRKLAGLSPEAVQRIFQGETLVMQPHVSVVPLPDAQGVIRENLPTMLAATPVRDAAGEIVAALAFRLRPENEYARALESSRAGDTGETYLFSKQGLMLSESRFIDQLHDLGLLRGGQDSHTALTLELRDPGGNLLKGYRPAVSRESLPLTRMAATAVTGVDGVDVSGYRDYRGVTVVGAWRWLPEYQFGITHEVDADEAYAPLYAIQRAFITVLTLLLVALITSAWFNIRQRNLDAALKEEQYLLHTLLDYLPDLIYFKDAGGRFLRVSKALSQRLLLDESRQAIGRTDSDFFPPEYSRQTRVDELALMQSGQSLVGKEEHPTWPDGSSTWVSTIKSPLIDDTGRVVGTFGLSHDVTALKETEIALRASEERFSLAVRGSTDGLWDWNVESNEVYYSPRFKELLGFGDHEFSNKFESWESRLHTDDRAATLQAIREHLECHQPYDVEYRACTKSGEYRWFRARGQAVWNGDGRATRMAGSITDITLQRRGEERFRLAVEASPSGMLIVDEQGRILLVNSQVERMFGYTRTELLGSRVERLVPDRRCGDTFPLRQPFLSVPEGAAQIPKQDLTACRRDGSEFEIELRLNPLHTEEGVAVLCSIVDVTERNEFLRALNAAKEQAEAANRTKSDFLANMSHEIRTPMNAVIGMTDLVLDTDLNPMQRDYLRTVLESADSLLSIINEILDFSKIEAGQIKLDCAPFSIRELMGDVLKSLAIRGHVKGLELAWHVAPDVHDALRGDVHRLRQVIVNLVGNAIKFTETGEVVVDVEQVESSADGVALHVCVRDTGIGIPEEQQKAIFEPFTQADMSTTRRFGGTGLGLTISANLVQLMGGRIWIESTVGTGSRFHFQVPFVHARPGEVDQAAAELAAELQGLPVLVVDDNATNRKILTEMLGNWGLSVVSVDGAEAALTRLEDERAAGRPMRLVITDLHMPDMDGLTLAERIQSTPELAGTALILLTSGSRVGDADRCDRLGMRHLLKPVKQSELRQAIVDSVSVPSRPALDRAGCDVVDESPGVTPQLTILLAEDGLANQKLAAGLLKRWGHTLAIAQNGREAVEMTAERTFDLILMDLQMPEMDGLQATRTIRERERDTSTHVMIVAMTAHALKGDRERCLEAGMDGYLSKPIRKEEFYATLQSLFSHSRPAE